MKCALCKARFRKSRGGERYVACADCASQRATDAVIRVCLERGARSADLLKLRRMAPSEVRFLDAMCILLRVPPAPPGDKPA